MQTTYEIALNEFREASAIVRCAFGAVSEARELQIIADSQHKAASIALGEAQARMDAADKALSAAREAPKPAPTPDPVFASFHDPKPGQVTAEHQAKAAGPFADIKPNGAVIDAQADGIGIG